MTDYVFTTWLRDSNNSELPCALALVHQLPVLPPSVFLSRCQSFETALACASSRKFHSEQKPNISPRLTFDYLLAWDIKGPTAFILLHSDQPRQTQTLSSYPSIFLTTYTVGVVCKTCFYREFPWNQKRAVCTVIRLSGPHSPCDLQRLQTWVTCRRLFDCFCTVFTLRDIMVVLQLKKLCSLAFSV